MFTIIGHLVSQKVPGLQQMQQVLANILAMKHKMPIIHQQSTNNPSKKTHKKAGNLFVAMEVHMAPNRPSPASSGPDFRPGYHKNSPGGRGAARGPTIKKCQRFWGPKNGSGTQILDFVREMSGMPMGPCVADWGIIWGP